MRLAVRDYLVRVGQVKGITSRADAGALGGTSVSTSGNGNEK